jgi:hypothetical protein
MKVRFLLAPLAAVTLALGGSVQGLASATATTTSTSVPIVIVVAIPCAGDLVQLRGNLHLVSTVVMDGSGGFHFSDLVNPQDVSGVGTPSGAMYRGTGETRSDTQSSGPPPINFTFVNNFKIIGQGPDNNLLIHENTHLTVNADGTVTATVDNFSSSCM